MPSIIYLTFVAGLALIVVAVLGGGLKKLRFLCFPPYPEL
jgi:hypothetical protein